MFDISLVIRVDTDPRTADLILHEVDVLVTDFVRSKGATPAGTFEGSTLHSSSVSGATPEAADEFEAYMAGPDTYLPS